MATQRPSAVSFFPVDHPAIAGTVRGKLESYRKQLMEELAVSTDYPDFKFRLGRVQGVDDAIQHCLDVENESLEKNRA